VCIANQAQGSPTIAEPRVLTIARWLIEIYTKHKLPKYADTFYKPLGYTKQEMEDDPNKVYSMILVAAYDRQPFTKIARGWESIWGTRSQENSLRTSLDKMGLLQVRVASELSLEEVSRRLRGVTFHGYRIDSDGAHTEYARTVKDIARLVSECQLLRLMMQTETPAQVESIFRLLHGIHGIGKTIASKIVMYTLREIGIGQIWRGHLYPAVEPILDEYHNARLTKELEQNFGVV
jgi:hypothetical protein